MLYTEELLLPEPEPPIGPPPLPPQEGNFNLKIVGKMIYWFLYTSI